MEITGQFVSGIGLGTEDYRVTIKVSPRELLEQSTLQQIGELSELINYPQQTKPEAKQVFCDCKNPFEIEFDQIKELWICGNCHFFIQSQPKKEIEKLPELSMAEKVNNEIQGVCSTIEFPLGQDEVAIGKAINNLLCEGWKFSNLTKTYIQFSRSWETK